MHIIILGAQGMLGSYLNYYFQKFHPNFQIHSLSRAQCPIPNTIQELSKFTETLKIPENTTNVWVFNAVGLTNKIDADEKTFFHVNATYSKWWYDICEKNNWQYVYFSTDCVFSGKTESSYDEKTKTDAKDTYGLSKISGEYGMIIRASIIGEDARHFRGFIEFAKRHHHREVDGFTNHTWNGITCLAMAQFCGYCVTQNISWSGVRHLIPEYTVTKHDLLKLVNDIWHLNLKITATQTVEPKHMILSSVYKSNYRFPSLQKQLNELKSIEIPNDQRTFRKILIIGGSGSLGQELIHQWQYRLSECIIFSRSEHKQWELYQKFPRVKFHMELGDVADYNKLYEIIRDHNPDTIIYAAAMKHVDRCETAVRQCINSNCLGFLNMLEAAKDLSTRSKMNLQKILYVSTDKACHPINVYGMTKSIAEHLVQQYKIDNVDVVGVRYGNVINSNGSIIPVLKNQGLDSKYESFTLTNPEMTRFYMTLGESVQLIEDTLIYGNSGELWIPKLRSMSIGTLFEIFSKKYKKSIKIIGIRPGEKVHESLLDIHELTNTETYNVDNRTCFIVSNLKKKLERENPTWNYCSSENLIDIDELTKLLDVDNML